MRTGRTDIPRDCPTPASCLRRRRSLRRVPDPLVISDGGNLTEELFGAVELQVKPHEAWTIKAFYGAQKAGIRCAGGQCRYLPGFDGARASVVGRPSESSAQPRGIGRPLAA